jgi:hypothetical protein
LPEASIRILERAFYPIDELAEEIPNHVPTPAAAAKPQHLTSDDDNDSSWAADGLKPNPSFAAVSPSSGWPASLWFYFIQFVLFPLPAFWYRPMAPPSNSVTTSSSKSATLVGWTSAEPSASPIQLAATHA